MFLIALFNFVAIFSLDNSLVDHQILKLCFIFILNAGKVGHMFATMVLNGIKQLPGLVFALTTVAAKAEGLRLPCASGRFEPQNACKRVQQQEGGCWVLLGWAGCPKSDSGSWGCWGAWRGVSSFCSSICWNQLLCSVVAPGCKALQMFGLLYYKTLKTYMHVRIFANFWKKILLFPYCSSHFAWNAPLRPQRSSQTMFLQGWARGFLGFRCILGADWNV